MLTREFVYRNVYSTRKWRELRWARLQHDEYICQSCKIRIADCVHHIEPIRQTDDWHTIAFDFENLQSLCNQCHKKEHEHLKTQKMRPERVAILNLLDKRHGVKLNDEFTENRT